jgi:acetylornithine deacetylase/succinyl-diaminopimelate desuccinylase-like protein
MRLQSISLWVVAFGMALVISTGSSLSGADVQAAAYLEKHATALLQEYIALLAIPNVASDSANIRRNAEAVAALFKRRGVAVGLLEGEGCPPLVLGKIAGRNVKRTVVFYAHYDGQPVDKSQWKDGPWTPVLRDGRLEDGGRTVDPSTIEFARAHDYRLYARSVSDDKAPIFALAAALDLLKDEGRPPTMNIVLLFEGEEEAGSPHLPALLQKYKDLIKAEALFICDGPIDQSGRMALDFGVRGTLGLELTAYGPNHPLHSGHYGNWAPNPISLLASLISSMRGRDGEIFIQGFSDSVRPITESDRRAIQDLPDIDQRLRQEYGLARSEADDARLSERILLPALNFRGFQAGGVGGQAVNAIPAEARASIDFRLVPDQKPETVRRLVEEHITRQGFHIIGHDPSPEERLSWPRLIKLEWENGYPPYRLALDDPFGEAVVKTLTEALGEAPLRVPALGGSAPLRMFADTLHVPVIGFPIVNYDNNQHGPNENLRLKNLWDGISEFAAVMSDLGKVW